MKKNNRFKIDTYKEGGNKSEWISHKIGVLINEGYEKDRAVAIAYSMYNQKHNKHQDGGLQSNLKNIYNIQPNVFNPSMGEGVKVFYRDPSDPQFLADRDSEFVKNEAFNLMKDTKAYNDYTNRINSNTPFVPTKLYGEYDKPTFAQQKSIRDIKYNVQTNKPKQGLPEGNYTKVYYNDGSVDYLDAQGEKDFQKMSNYRNYMSSKKEPNFNSNPIASYQDGGWYDQNPPLFTTQAQNNLISLSPEQTTNTNNNVVNNQNTTPNFNQPYQFFNPYSDVDLAGGAQALGRGIESGSPLETVAGALKVATGTARNIFSGIGQERVKNEALKTYYNNQRDAMTGFYQNGGEQLPPPDPQQVLQMVIEALNSGISPEEIAQQLMQMGVPQDQIQQIIQSAMQQGQPMQQQEIPQMKDGGEYISQLIGKKITGYKLNEQTGDYEISYE